MTPPKAMEILKSEIKALGGELLGPTNPYEVLRFRTMYGVGVVYCGKRGETWNPAAVKARDHIKAQRGTFAPVIVVGRIKKTNARVNALLERDGAECFFCAKPLDGDVSQEHLVSRVHGGPNHISNMFLAHAQCNSKAGHLSAPEKIAIRIAALLETRK